MAKVITVRIPEDQVEKLETLATFDGVAMAEEIREAIELLLKTKSQDPAYIQNVRNAYQNARKTLEQLEGGVDIISALGDPLGAVKPAAVNEEVTAVAAAPIEDDREVAIAGHARGSQRSRVRKSRRPHAVAGS